MAQQDDLTVSTNGSTPHAAEVRATNGATTSLDDLRTRPDNIHLFRGYGPLVVGIILFVLMVTLAPTVAPEQVVERPVDAPATEEAP